MFYFICVCVRARMFVYVCALLYERQRTTLGNPFSPFILFCTRVFCVSASLRTQDELALKLLGKLISPLQSQKECREYGCTWLHLASCVCPGAWTQVITLAWQVHLPSESGPGLCEVLSRAQRIWKRMFRLVGCNSSSTSWCQNTSPNQFYWKHNAPALCDLGRSSLLFCVLTNAPSTRYRIVFIHTVCRSGQHSCLGFK